MTKKKVPTLEVVTKFTPVGIVDNFVGETEENGSKYSQMGKVRTVSSNSARNRIEQLRRLQGPLIRAEKASKSSLDEEEHVIDNAFVNKASTYTLSVYNGAEKYSRPQTAPHISNWLPKQSVKNLPPVPEEDQPQVEEKLPNF